MSKTEYSITFQNYSTNFGNVCIYQTDPNLGPDVMSLAWFAKPTHPTTEESFTWTIDYGFIWDETGELVPGVVFDASQVWPADLTQNNKIKFSRTNDAYTFSDLSKGSISGVLEIDEDDTIPLKRASIGISMAGAGTFVKQAQPNMTLFFEPHPEYWITFGNFEPGEVLNITEITNKQRIEFDPGVFAITAILNKDNTWKIK
jgi:hypothetical protein